MAVPVAVLPDASPFLTWAFEAAMDTVDPRLAMVPGYQYTAAVYNLGGDFLINWAQDQAGQTPPDFWSKLRASFNISAFTAGVVSSSSDEITSQTFDVINAAKDFLMSDLQNLKTPYGRAYVSIAMKQGTQWGLS